MLKVIADTNIMISGLFFKGTERKLLEFLLTDKVLLILPDYVVRETKNIIKRKSRKLGNEERAMFMLELITKKCRIIPNREYKKNLVKAKKIIQDEKDVPILAAVLSIKHDYFLSGDKHFKELKLKTHITTKELIEKIE